MKNKNRKHFFILQTLSHTSNIIGGPYSAGGWGVYSREEGGGLRRGQGGYSRPEGVYIRVQAAGGACRRRLRRR